MKNHRLSRWIFIVYFFRETWYDLTEWEKGCVIMIETVTTDRFSMQYFRFGRGERIFVILPGLSVQSVMSSEEQVKAAYDIFADDYTVYLFDRRADLPPVYTVRDMARDTAEAIRALGLRDIYLFGASQGGMMAQVIAIEYPELVRRMALGSTSPRVTEEAGSAIETWIRLAEAKDAVGLYLEFGKLLYPPDVFEQFRGALIGAGKSVTDAELERFRILARGTEGFSVVDELHKIQCPVLILGDYEDAVLDSDGIMLIPEKLDLEPQHLYMYTGYGHAAFDTAPDYKQRIARFFAE